MILALAMVLDALFGEPRWLYDRVPHPAVLIGRAIGAGDRALNAGQLRFWKGAALLLVICFGSAMLGWLIQSLGVVITGIVAATLLAQKSLVDHVQAVATALRYGVQAGRDSVAMIVGRDTRDMTAAEVSRAAIESAAENLSDGVIAPIFWFALAGLPGLIVYKVVNTADSMIGYRTERHEQFGKAAARIDDVMNWIPARLTALMLQLAYGRWPSLSALSAQARLHRSPNAGWPETALAQGQNIALSGPRSYGGVTQDFPWVNGTGRKALGPSDIDTAARALWRVWMITFALVCGGALAGLLI